MDETTLAAIADLFSEDRDRTSAGFMAVMAATEQRVDWAYDIWDRLVADLTHKDNRQRAHASQILANLAKSDPEQRILKDFDTLLDVTKDERFVTARHCMQALWRVGVVQQQVYMDGLERRFRECIDEKNCTLIRYDILESMRKVYEAVHDEAINAKALALIETEDDLKYRKKYATLWKKA
jgi:hypothetical protein